MKVSEVMTRHPVCCWPSSSTLTAALLMQENDTGILPVIEDPFTTRLVGVVTDRDLCLHVVAPGRDPSSTWVDRCMTEAPVCCAEADDVFHALELMTLHRVRRLPVVDEKHEIVGMVSLSDLARKADIEASLIGAAFQSICEPAAKSESRVDRMITAA
jgi:CBS domain-containing protein